MEQEKTLLSFVKDDFFTVLTTNTINIHSTESNSIS